MDIHKPKAAHNLREFLIEIGTIICGILIALGLEQVVEQLHWRHAVGEEREALKDELRQISSSMLGRLSIDDCYVRRLAEVNEVVRRHDAGEPLGIVQPLGRALYPPTYQQIWALAVADQSLAHMSLEEKRRFSNAYKWVNIYERITEDERSSWRSLQVLNHADVLTPSDWSQVRKDLELARETHAIIEGSFNSWIQPIHAVAGQATPTAIRQFPSVTAFCTAMLKNSPA